MEIYESDTGLLSVMNGNERVLISPQISRYIKSGKIRHVDCYSKNIVAADGGCLAKNPSSIGGTVSACVIEDGQYVNTYGALILCNHEYKIFDRTIKAQPKVSNNYTEMLALLYGFTLLPPNWCGTVISDSQVTMQRVFGTSSWNNAEELRPILAVQKNRLKYFPYFNAILVHGHPTKEQLKTGFKNSFPVSEYNVWCDRNNKEMAESYKEISIEIPKEEKSIVWKRKDL